MPKCRKTFAAVAIVCLRRGSCLWQFNQEHAVRPCEARRVFEARPRHDIRRGRYRGRNHVGWATNTAAVSVWPKQLEAKRMYESYVSLKAGTPGLHGNVFVAYTEKPDADQKGAVDDCLSRSKADHETG